MTFLDNQQNATGGQQDKADRKIALALDKAQKSARKADRMARQAEQELYRLENALAKREKARRWLPDEYPDWAKSTEAHPYLELDEFVRTNDRHVFDRVCHALQSATYAKVFDSLAGIFDCSGSEICLMEERAVTRRGKKCRVAYLRCAYNPDFNELLKSTEQAFFDRKLKSWNLILKSDTEAVMSGNFAKYFSVVIDLDRLIIMENTAIPEMAAQKKAAFRRSPFHVAVNRSDIFGAIFDSRPADEIKGDTIHVHNGSEFVAFPEQETIWTQSPFLLFRYSVTDGRPRYVSLSTLGMAAEEVSFGNDGKTTSTAIARFISTCRALNLPAFEIDPCQILREQPGQRSELQGSFNRFSKSLQTIRSVIPDLTFAPLCSDYVTLLQPDLGAESDCAGIIAYVMPFGRDDRYITKIAAYFGHDVSEYPIIFTRSMLDMWNEQVDSNFLTITAHELGHWLAYDNDGEFPIGPAHGIAWAVCQDLLSYLFTGNHAPTGYRAYHPDDAVAIGNIEFAITKIGIPALERIRACRNFTRKDILTITKACLSHIEAMRQ